MDMEAKNWRTLTPEEERVIVRKGTEYPFTGQYNKWEEKGTFVCRRCEAPLYSSSDKFDSGCGWPSFYEPIRTNSVLYKEDLSYGMTRTEVLCGRCDAHLGHVFDDGPNPTGKRFCMNSISMDFEPQK